MPQAGLDKGDLLTLTAMLNKAMAENLQYAMWLEERDKRIAELEAKLKETQA